MRTRLKPLDQQVVVITGASSGIGLVTARMAAKRGARLVLVARNEEALRSLVAEIEAIGGQAAAVVADVGIEEDVRRIADAAVQRFGGVDTWVNNAGVSVYGRSYDVPVDEMRRVFETNFWGVVHGSLVAVGLLRVRGGALINIGSVLSDAAAPIQGIYTASKHAIKGWTDALRMEIENDRLPISVTLVKPGSIDTPYPDHAANHMDVEPKNRGVVYPPEAVAEAVLYCAEHPRRDMFVGSQAKLMSLAARFMPGIADRVIGALMPSMERGDAPRGHDRGTLERAGSGLRERGGGQGWIRGGSWYTRATMHPVAAGMTALGAAAVIAAVAGGLGRRATRRRRRGRAAGDRGERRPAIVDPLRETRGEDIGDAALREPLREMADADDPVAAVSPNAGDVRFTPTA